VTGEERCRSTSWQWARIRYSSSGCSLLQSCINSLDLPSGFIFCCWARETASFARDDGGLLIRYADPHFVAADLNLVGLERLPRRPRDRFPRGNVEAAAVEGTLDYVVVERAF